MKTAEPDGERPVPAGWRTIPRGIWALGFVSLFMDTSSELIHSLLPVFLVSVIGASALSVGLIEGVAEAYLYIGQYYFVNGDEKASAGYFRKVVDTQITRYYEYTGAEVELRRLTRAR